MDDGQLMWVAHVRRHARSMPERCITGPNGWLWLVRVLCLDDRDASKSSRTTQAKSKQEPRHATLRPEGQWKRSLTMPAVCS